MEVIADESMRQVVPTARNCYLVILKSAPNRNESGTNRFVWEHGRRDFRLRQEGVLSMICEVGIWMDRKIRTMMVQSKWVLI